MRAPINEALHVGMSAERTVNRNLSRRGNLSFVCCPLSFSSGRVAETQISRNLERFGTCLQQWLNPNQPNQTKCQQLSEENKMFRQEPKLKHTEN